MTIGDARTIGRVEPDLITMRVSLTIKATLVVGVLAMLVEVTQDESLDMGNKKLPLSLAIN